MDDFADFVDLAFPPKEPGKEVDPRNLIKVALIDDGVKSSYDNLDKNIDGGESWVKQSSLKDPQSPYVTSAEHHGTVMAYFIRRVCPHVRLYVLKLDPNMAQNRPTFSIESATEVLHPLRTENRQS
jgi:hypothetical protein